MDIQLNMADNNNHLLLSDNSPYDVKTFKKINYSILKFHLNKKSVCWFVVPSGFMLLADGVALDEDDLKYLFPVRVSM